MWIGALICWNFKGSLLANLSIHGLKTSFIFFSVLLNRRIHCCNKFVVADWPEGVMTLLVDNKHTYLFLTALKVVLVFLQAAHQISGYI